MALQVNRTPLHRVADTGRVDEIRVLLEYGADKDAKDNVLPLPPPRQSHAFACSPRPCQPQIGYTPRDRAKRKGIPEIVRLFEAPDVNPAAAVYHELEDSALFPILRTKLMALGEARRGKTSTLKALKGAAFDPEEPSTCGIVAEQLQIHHQEDVCRWKVTVERTAEQKRQLAAAITRVMRGELTADELASQGVGASLLARIATQISDAAAAANVVASG